MFGTKKNPIADEISDAVRPNIDLVKNAHGVPTGFWQDSYVLGYLMGQINAFMSILGGDGMSIAEKGRVVVASFAELSGLKGKDISEMSMVYASQEDPDFLRANQNGMFIAIYKADKLPDAADNPVVIATRQSLDAQGMGTSAADIAASLTQNHWVDQVKTRLSI